MSPAWVLILSLLLPAWAGAIDGAVVQTVQEIKPHQISEKECLAIGGHCWSNYMPYLSYSVHPPDRTEHRECIHCGIRQEKIPEEWKDVPREKAR